MKMNSLKSIFKVIESVRQNEELLVELVIDPGHSIFAGHFPDQPVLPGVVQMEIVRLLLEQEIGWPLSLQASSNVKFLAMVDPKLNNKIKIEIREISRDSNLVVSVVMFNGTQKCMKMKSSYKICT